MIKDGWCPSCYNENKTSKITLYPSNAYTLISREQPFIDEEFRFHDHGRRNMHGDFRCSNGHRGTFVQKLGCDSCGTVDHFLLEIKDEG